MFGFLRRGQPAPALPSREVEHWRSHAGFSHPDWTRLTEPAAVYVDSWLARLKEESGPEFRLDRSAHFLMLSPYSQRKAGYQLQFLEHSRERLLSWLGPAARLPQGKHLALIFANPEQYWRYLSYHTPDQGGNSSGMCLRQHAVHIVTFDHEEVDTLQNILCHELTHDLLSDRKVPLWLEEGLCQLLPGSRGTRDFRGQLAELQEVAERYGLWDFWTGQAFGLYDKRQELAYTLSEALIRLLLDHPGSANFGLFLSQADIDDSGQATFQEHYGSRLEELVATFLGPGDWRPPAAPAIRLQREPDEEALSRALAEASEQEAEDYRFVRSGYLMTTPRWDEVMAEVKRLSPRTRRRAHLFESAIWSLLKLPEDPPQGEEVLKLLADSDPAQVPLLRGYWHYARGRFQEARKDYEHCLRTGQYAAEAIEELAWTYWKLGQPEPAKEYLKRCGRGLNALLLQAELALENDLLEEAGRLLKECLDLKKDDVTSWHLVGKLALRQGDLEEAKLAFRHCLECQGHWPPEWERQKQASGFLVQAPG